MKELYEALYRETGSGRCAALVTVMETEGSAPGKAGAVMAVFERAAPAGTVGGGAVELEAQKRARELLRRPAAGSEIREFELGGELGMACGGRARLLFEVFHTADDEDIPFLRRLAAVCDGREQCCYARRLERGRVTARKLIFGGGDFDENFPERELSGALSGGTVYIGGEPGWFLSPLSARARAFVYGGGHVARELVPLLARCGFSVTLCEERAEFARPEDFSGAREALLCSFDALPERALPKAGDHAVVLTHGHEGDFAVLTQVLKTPARYVGCIGSRNKAALVRERLLAAGFAPEEADRVHSPVGLAIGARTPAEIAVSIAAEMITEKNKK